MLVGNRHIHIKEPLVQSYSKVKSTIVIPCHDEYDYIGDIVKQCKKYVSDVVVVDNYSNDHTDEAALESGADVVYCYAKGAGIATFTGMEIALNSKYHSDIIVTLDGDGQHNPEEIPQLIRPIINGEADVVIGSRFLDKSLCHIPFYRRVGIALINFLYNYSNKVKITDTQCGFRAYSAKVLQECKFTEYGFAFSIESLVRIRKRKYTIVEIPAVVYYHPDLEANSTMNPVKQGLKVAWAVIKWRLKVEVLHLAE